MIPANKNIAVLHPYLDKKGGASSMMVYLSNLLTSKNNKVSLYSFYRKKSKFFSFFKIAYTIRKNDYIFIGNSPMHFVGVISKILFRSKAKIIWWHHHYPWYYSKNTNVYIKFKKLLEKIIIKNIDIIIVNSKYLQNTVKDIYNIDSKILYPVLDDKFLDYSFPKITKNISKILFSYGRWVKGKNLEMIFSTYDNLKNKVPNLILKIGGEGDEIFKFKNKYKNDENVKFLGYLDKTKIIKNLENSSLFLFSSKIDSFGLVIVESMSIGVPVISYNISGPSEIIKNGINGFLVNSSKEFILKSYEVLINDELRQNLSYESVKTSKTFGRDNFSKNLSNIF